MVLVRILLVPVTVRQIHSMQNLQAHAPEMKEIQQRWKHDKQRQNEELMKFYRENKINPAASCLPIVLQIPIFIALFYVLRDFEDEIFPNYPESSLELLGLVDITEPTIDGWGPLLLVVYVASQLTSSYYMSASMQRAQRILLMVLPIVFIPFILNFPSGPDDLLADDEPVDDRAGLHHADADAEARPDRGRREEELAHAAEGRAPAGREGERPGAAGRSQGRRARRRRARRGG